MINITASNRKRKFNHDAGNWRRMCYLVT